MTADSYSNPEYAGTDTGPVKLSDDVKSNGKVTRVGGKILGAMAKSDSMAKKPEMRKK
jgi:hypothetical protein